MEAARSLSLYAPQDEGSSWPMPMRQFASLGWQEFLLPDGARYFSNPSLRIVTDVDLRNAERLEAIATSFDPRDTEVLPPPEWELWLRDAGEPTTAFIPLKAWVHHGARVVLFERPSSDPGEVIDKVVDSKLLRIYVHKAFVDVDDSAETDMEYQYWSFVVSHPAHTPLSSECVSEAIDVLTWSYTGLSLAMLMSRYHSFPCTRPAATIVAP
jgi:hypothetical protein